MTWKDAAREWIVAALGECSIAPVRERSWGAIWRVTSADGEFWFKAPHESMRTEVRLRRALEKRAGQWVLPLVAADDERGWQLTQHQGPTLAVLDGERGRSSHAGVAHALAEIQRRVPAEVLRDPELEVFNPAEAPSNLERWGAWLVDLPASHPAKVDAGALSAAQCRLQRATWQWQDVVGKLPGMGIDHNDLHLGNAFPGPLISDWGDAVIAHPFCSMRRLAFSALEGRGIEAVEGVEDAYLKVWGRPAEFRPALHIAYALAAPQRLHAWKRLGDLAAVARYARFIAPLIPEAGLPLEQLTTA